MGLGIIQFAPAEEEFLITKGAVTETYIFGESGVTVPWTDWHVHGYTAEAQAANLTTRINEMSSLVQAAVNPEDATNVQLTALEPGAAGNTIVVTSSWGWIYPGDFEGGEDGTVIPSCILAEPSAGSPPTAPVSVLAEP